MTARRQVDRRTFIRCASAGVATAVAPLVLPLRVCAASPEAPSNWFNIALIGCGGRGMAMAAESDFNTAALVWDPTVGVQVRTRAATVTWDQNDQMAAPVLKFTGGSERPLKNPKLTQTSNRRLSLAYEVATPEGTTLQVTRELTLADRNGETELVETFQLLPAKPISTDLEIQRPFAIIGRKVSSATSAVCPLFNGWAKPYPLSDKPLEADYRIGNALGGRERLARARHVGHDLRPQSRASGSGTVVRPLSPCAAGNLRT